MAIAKNASEEEVASGGIQLFTGIAAMSVLAVNPSLTELHALDLKFQKEPNYIATFKDGTKAQKCVIWLGNKDTKVSLETLLTPGPWISKKADKKHKWMNKSGQDMWAPITANGTPDPSCFKDWHQDTDSFYLCPRGIDTVTDFLKAWANVADGDEVMLDTVDAICKGDMTELKQLITALAGNKLRVLVYVRDGKYQGVYNQHFGRLRPERNDLFSKAMGANGVYGQVPGEFSIPWQSYTPGVVQADPVADGDAANEEDWMKDAEPDAKPDPVDEDAF